MSLGYISIHVIVDGKLVEDRPLASDEPVREAIGEVAASAALSGLRTELWLLLHEHHLLDDEDCDCDVYLSPPGPFCILNVIPEPTA